MDCRTEGGLTIDNRQGAPGGQGDRLATGPVEGTGCQPMG